MKEIEAEPVIDRMARALGVRTDSALSKHLGYGASAVSNWRTRNRVPYTECVHLATTQGMSLDWLILGLGRPELAQHSTVADDTGDPRAQRIVGFVQQWMATHAEDSKVWLEMQLARAVPEYAEWVAARAKH